MEVVLENAVEQKTFSVIMLDIDYFKLYNDTYGHQAGDECLTRVAEVLKKSVRTPEDVVSRYGGEEFVVILFNCPANIAEKVALRIQDGLRMEAIPHSASTVSDHVTVSMGIASMAEGLAGTEIIAVPMPRCTGQKRPGGIGGRFKQKPGGAK
jgi:diguanylate cyclase (GGDEF)-like protein